MKDDIKNLKEITDLVLKDIYVTDELKSKTLELCRKEKSNILKPFLAAASSAAIIAVSLTGYQYFSHKVDNNLSNKQIVQSLNNTNSSNSINSTNKLNTKSSNSKINENVKPEIDYKNTNDKNTSNSRNLVNSSNSNSVTESHNSVAPSALESKNVPVDNSTKTTQKNDSAVSPTKNDTAPMDKTLKNQVPQSSPDNIEINSSSILKDSFAEKNSNNIATSPNNPSIAALADTLSTAEAEKYWGSELMLPFYIPNNFELTDISIPKDNKEIYVKLTYSSKNSYFKITQNKSTKYNVTGKSTDINGTSATVTQNKDETNPSTIITQIIWIKDNIQYSVVGNISDVELINISKSIK